jgi:oxygen-independent coproporphyrinogen-3 oxidase
MKGRLMPLGIYLHFPYCLSKCPYCDFASVAEPQIPHARYAQALARELLQRIPSVTGRAATSLYIGGGTPSLFEPEALARVLEAIRAAIPVSPDAEVTLEANPGASDAARFLAYRSLGVNRLSLGVQSFDDPTLHRLGRRHDAREAFAAVDAARRAGFESLALDLIYGAPGQSLAMAEADARSAALLTPEHLSCYALTLDHLAEEVPMATAVRAGRLAVPDDDLQWEMGRRVREVLEAAGYRRYEISNYARPGLEARHNALYWKGGEYLGLGCGASGFALRDPKEPARGGRRWANHRSPERYLESVERGELPEASSEALTGADLLRERLAMGLRMADGVAVREVAGLLGVDCAPLLATAQSLVERGLARWSGDRLSLTDRGMDFHTSVAVEFV